MTRLATRAFAAAGGDLYDASLTVGRGGNALQRLLFVPRVLALTVVLVLAHVIAAAGAGLASPTPAEPTRAESVAADVGPDVAASLRLLGLVVGVCALEAIAIGAVLAVATAHGMRLIVGLAAAIFGVMTLQPQIEALAFGVIPMAWAARIATMGLGIAAVVSPLSVLMFWRVRTTGGAGRIAITRAVVRPWAAILIGGAVYVALYTLFGFFIAWQSPEVRAYYGGDASRSYLSHLWALQLRVPWFGPFQFLRGCLWTVLAMLILSLIGGSRRRAGVVLGLFFAIMMNAQLLLPNALMPETVRLLHVAETAPSNFILGLALAWLIRRGRVDAAGVQGTLSKGR